MSKCWYCNNELTTGDNPKHFGICNKCYDEMFKSGDTIIRSLTDKIAKLQKQLEEKEKTIQGLVEAQKLLEQSASYQMFLDVQKQLKSQPREIVERIKKELETNGNDYCEIRRVNSPHTNHQYAWFNYVCFRDYLDTILKEYQK